MCRSSQIIFNLIVALLLSACGGGGGGGSASSISTSEYEGPTTQAELTTANSAQIVTSILGGEDDTKVVEPLESSDRKNHSLSISNVQSISQTVITMVANDINGNSKKVSASAVAVDDTYVCNSGNIRVTGSLNDINYTGTLNIAYNNCSLSGETWNGTVRMVVDEVRVSTGDITDSTSHYSNLSITGTGFNLSMTGTIRSQVNYTTNTITDTLNVVTTDSVRNRQTMTENYVISSVYNSLTYPSYVSVTLSGKHFDSRYGYVIVSTTAPLLYSSLYNNYPSSGGPMLIQGASGALISITPQSSTSLSLSLNLDGDSDYESEFNLLWADLSTGVGTQLADTDGDGMHDGWERANSLDPNNADDASLDSDGDGATNLQEYLGRTDPNNQNSKPQNADISLTLSSVERASVGVPIVYTASVRNVGPNTSSNVMVTLSSPENITFVGNSQNYYVDCDVIVPSTCIINTLYSGRTENIAFTAEAVTVTSLAVTASVSATTLDLNQTNNSAVFTTEFVALRTDSIIDGTAIPAWTTLQGNPYHNGYVPITLDSSEFSERWSRSLFGGNSLHQVVSADGKVFVAQNLNYDSNQTLTALSSINGSEMWSNDYGYLYNFSPVTYNNDKLYVQSRAASGGYLRSLDVNTGDLDYRVAINTQMYNSFPPVVVENNIYVSGLSDNKLYSLDTLTGNEEWKFSHSSYVEWTSVVDSNYIYIYVPSRNGELTAIDRVSGQKAFSILDPNGLPTYNNLNDIPVLSAQNNLLVTNFGRLINFDLSDKEVRWQLNGLYKGPVSVADNKLYVINDGVLNVLNEATGALLWSWEAPLSRKLVGKMILTNSHLFLHDSFYTYAIDLISHNSVWSYALAGELSLSDDGALYIAGNNGRLVAINISGDEDGDGVPGWWEVFYGYSDSNNIDANLDMDSDGLTTLQEYLNSTDPDNSDTDGDGLTDGEEVNDYSTDPTKTDTDGDGLNDYDEINVHSSNPIVVDTDSDGFGDGEEVNRYNTDPTDASSFPPNISSYNQSFEASEIPVGWSTPNGSTSAWTLTTTDASLGSKSLRSGVITHSQNSDVTYTNLFASGTLSFSAKVDAESCCDKLDVYVDDVLVQTITASSNWNDYQLTLTADEHAIKWRYRKDGSVSTGSDAAYIDGISFVAD